MHTDLMIIRLILREQIINYIYKYIYICKYMYIILLFGLKFYTQKKIFYV